MPTQTKENYLKAIFSIHRQGEVISITKLSEQMQVSKSTANSMVKNMEEMEPKLQAFQMLNLIRMILILIKLTKNI